MWYYIVLALVVITFGLWVYISDDYPSARCYKCGSRRLKQTFADWPVVSNYLRPMSSEASAITFRIGHKCKKCGFEVHSKELIPKRDLMEPGNETLIREWVRRAWMEENPGKDPDKDI